MKGNIGVVPHIQFDDGLVDLQTKRKKVDHTHKSGLPRGGLAYTKNEKTQQRTKLTAIPLLRAVAPASPILLRPRFNSSNALFSYTGTHHSETGLPEGEGASPYEK